MYLFIYLILVFNFCEVNNINFESLNSCSLLSTNISQTNFKSRNDPLIPKGNILKSYITSTHRKCQMKINKNNLQNKVPNELNKTILLHGDTNYTQRFLSAQKKNKTKRIVSQDKNYKRNLFNLQTEKQNITFQNGNNKISINKKEQINNENQNKLNLQSSDNDNRKFSIIDVPCSPQVDTSQIGKVSSSEMTGRSKDRKSVEDIITNSSKLNKKEEALCSLVRSQ